jgi:hypothetical protein
VAYFRIIALVTSVALVILFYLVRRIIDATFLPPKPPNEASTTLQEVLVMGHSLAPEPKLQIPIVPQHKPLIEMFQEFFKQDDAIVIRHMVLFKITHYPMSTVIGMLLTRSP